MTRKRALQRTLAFLGAWAILLSGFLAVVRPWYQHWGATPEELQRSLLGDRIVTGHVRQETRAITIHAPIERAWPWLAQIGQYRGGFYSFDQLENAVGCEMPTVDVLTRAHQVWQVGDSLWMYGREKAGGMGFAVLRELIPGRALAYSTTAPGSPKGQVDGSWTFVMESVDAATTRFIIRGRAPLERSAAWAAFDIFLFEPMHFLMERRMMLGIQELAERGVRDRTENTAHIALWVITLALFVWAGVGVFRRERLDVAIATFVATGFVFQFLTLRQPTPLLGGVIVLALAAGPRLGRLLHRLQDVRFINPGSRPPGAPLPAAGSVTGGGP